MISTNVKLAISADIFESFIDDALIITGESSRPNFRFFFNTLSDLVTQFHFFGVIPPEFLEGVIINSDEEESELFYLVCSDLERKLEMEKKYVGNRWSNRSQR